MPRRPMSEYKLYKDNRFIKRFWLSWQAREVAPDLQKRFCRPGNRLEITHPSGRRGVISWEQTPRGLLETLIEPGLRIYRNIEIQPGVFYALYTNDIAHDLMTGNWVIWQGQKRRWQHLDGYIEDDEFIKT